MRGNGRRRQPSRRAATRAGTRPCAGPVTRLETFPGLPEVFVTQLRLGHGYRDVDAVGPIWVWMYRSGRLEGLVVCSAGCVPRPGLLLTSSFGTVSGRASTSVWLMILTNFRRGSIPECGCILPLLRDMV